MLRSSHSHREMTILEILEVEKLWYKALFEEDCLRVKELLGGNPELLKVGWKSDDNLTVKGSPDNHWKPSVESPWMGRTALHVGARRGDVKLVEQVLILCGVHPNHPQAPRTTTSIEISEILETHPGQAAQGTSDGAKRKAKDVAGSSHGGYASKGDQRTMESGLESEKSGKALRKYNSSRGLFSTSSLRKGKAAWLVSQDELRELLLAKDGKYELEALAMATLQGNIHVIEFLVYALGKCKNSPYEIKPNTQFPAQVLDENDSRQRIELRKVTKKVIHDLEPVFMEACEEEYHNHRDFNFLLLEEYLFHFSCTSRFEEVFQTVDKQLFGEKFWEEVSLAEEEQKKSGQHEEADKQQKTKKLSSFLLTLHDGQGRSPYHVAVDEGTHSSFMLYSHKEISTDMFRDMNAPDGSGKTSRHRAAATGTKDIMVRERREDFHLVSSYPELTMRSFSLGQLSEANGFRSGTHGFTPLQAAIIHNNFERLEDVLGLMFGESEPWNMLYRLPMGQDFVGLDPVELACVVGADVAWVRVVEGLRKKAYLEKSKTSQLSMEQIAGDKHLGGQVHKQVWPILHYVATYGNYEMLKLFIAELSYDPFVEDTENNTALHCVMKDSLQNMEFNTHLLDYVDCKHLFMKDQRKHKGKDILGDNLLADKKGCVNLLLQAGCDIFKINKYNDVPYPQGRYSSAPFLSWWYEQQAKEFAAIENNLKNAANAISVVATLVATASFVGPLQPPRGLTDEQEMDCENRWVATFIFCNTLSFYLAIVAIILSLVPSLPMPEQAMFQELRRTKIMVGMAVGVLFPSIVSVLIAFASSSIAVVSSKRVSSNVTSRHGRNLTIISLCIGGLFILGAFIFFLVRFLGICFPKNSWIKRFYKLTSL